MVYLHSFQVSYLALRFYGIFVLFSYFKALNGDYVDLVDDMTAVVKVDCRGPDACDCKKIVGNLKGVFKIFLESDPGFEYLFKFAPVGVIFRECSGSADTVVYSHP